MTTITVIPTPTLSETKQKTAPHRRLFTVDELFAMVEAGIVAEDERIELLDGEILEMPPIGDPHADGTDRLDESFKEQLRRRARVRVQGPVRINDNSLLQPDIAVLRLRDDYHRRTPTPADVLLLIEMADSSLQMAREVKLAQYADAGIPEVWIANVRGAAGGRLFRPGGRLVSEPSGGDRRRQHQPAGVSRRVFERSRLSPRVRFHYDHNHPCSNPPVLPATTQARTGANPPPFHGGRSSGHGSSRHLPS